MFWYTGYGVRTDIVTKYTARIILLSMIPYLILELSKVFNSSSATRAGVLIALIITVILLVAYCTFQVKNLIQQNDHNIETYDAHSYEIHFGIYQKSEEDKSLEAYALKSS